MTEEMVNRKGLRFPAETGTLIHIDLHPEVPDFNPGIVGLVIDEAAKGCGAIILTHRQIAEGDFCKVKVGRLAPIKAEIKWIKQLDAQVMKIGLLYAGGQ